LFVWLLISNKNGMRYFLLLFFISFTHLVQAQQSFQVRLGFTASSSTQYQLKFTDQGVEKTIAMSKDGSKWMFKGTINQKEPVYASIIQLEDGEFESVKSFWLGAGVVDIKKKKDDDIEDAEVISKHPYQLHQNELDRLVRPISVQRSMIEAKLSLQTPREDVRAYLRQIDSLEKREEQVKRNYIRMYPDRYIGLHAMSYSMMDWGVDSTKVLFEKMSAALKETSYGLKVQKYISLNKNIQEGSDVVDIVQLSPTGDTLRLSDLKGKWVLIDFWASWCGPCREQNPELVDLYKKWKDKGFEIFAVSLDQRKEDWLAAIKKDSLSWLHVSELNEFENTAAYVYGVNAVPTNYLVDPKGKVVKKDLEPDEIDEFLSEVFHSTTKHQKRRAQTNHSLTSQTVAKALKPTQ
jgi:thiol-disulfide isomerase/thioredoxin